jgi:hypothetical protein
MKELIVCMGDARNAFRILARSKKKTLGRTRLQWRIILK